MEYLKINKEEIIEMLKELSFNILIQYINKDLTELERIKYTARNLKQGVITEKLAELIIDRANEMYDVAQDNKRLLHWEMYIEGYSKSEVLHIPIRIMNKEIREFLVKFYLTQDEFSKLKELLKNSDSNSNDKELEKELEKNTIFPENFNKRKVEIRVDGNIIKTISEYDPTVIEVVKKLNYRWNSSKKIWEREINKFNGTLVDRIVELSTKLLSKGYAVKAPEEYLESIKKEEFKIEQTRWIAWNNEKNLLVVNFEYNEKIKNALKNIKNTYNNYKYYVKLDYYKELLEFADTFNFSISEKAKQMIDQYIREFNNKKVNINKKGE